MSESSAPVSTLPGKQMVTSFVVAETLLLVGNLLVRLAQREGWLPAWAIATIAIASALPMVWFSIQFFRMLRSNLDEMIQRVVLEGLSFAFVIFVPLAGLYVNARAAGLVPPRLDAFEVMLIPAILAGVGILISWSRLK